MVASVKEPSTTLIWNSAPSVENGILSGILFEPSPYEPEKGTLLTANRALASHVPEPSVKSSAQRIFAASHPAQVAGKTHHALFQPG